MKKKGVFLTIIGAILLAAAGVLTCYNIYESRQAQTAADAVAEKMYGYLNEKKGDKTNLEQGNTVPDCEVFSDKEMPVIELDGEKYVGMLHIPDLNVTLPVMEEWSYEKLKKAPCVYSGSIYEDNMVVAGHNYRSHFSRLKKLNTGSVIQFTDVEGTVSEFIFERMEILKPEEVDLMCNEGDWDLTLFTCTYGGSERYTLRCVRK